MLICPAQSFPFVDVNGLKSFLIWRQKVVSLRFRLKFIKTSGSLNDVWVCSAAHGAEWQGSAYNSTFLNCGKILKWDRFGQWFWYFSWGNLSEGLASEKGESFFFYSSVCLYFFTKIPSPNPQSPNWQAMPKVTKVEKGSLNLPKNLTMSSQSDGFTILNEIFSNHKSYNAFQNNEKREKGK